MGRKRVTKVSGLEYFFIDPTLLAKEVQHRFAASTSIDPVPGAKKGELEVLIQGYCAQASGAGPKKKINKRPSLPSREKPANIFDYELSACVQELSKSLVDDHGVPKRFVFVKDKTAK